MEEYDVTVYPEGYERVRDEELVFLPEDPEVREAFMVQLLDFMLFY